MGKHLSNAPIGKLVLACKLNCHWSIRLQYNALKHRSIIVIIIYVNLLGGFVSNRTTCKYARFVIFIIQCKFRIQVFRPTAFVGTQEIETV